MEEGKTRAVADRDEGSLVRIHTDRERGAGPHFRLCPLERLGGRMGGCCHLHIRVRDGPRQDRSDDAEAKAAAVEECLDCEHAVIHEWHTRRQEPQDGRGSGAYLCYPPETGRVDKQSWMEGCGVVEEEGVQVVLVWHEDCGCAE